MSKVLVNLRILVLVYIIQDQILWRFWFNLLSAPSKGTDTQTPAFLQGYDYE